MSFTLFVILPNEDVCSLRSLTSGTSIRVVRKKLELAAGLPAQTYRLTCPEGRLLHEDHVLMLDSNVWDGFIVRAVFLDSWQELYERVVAGDVAHVLQDGGVHLPSDVVWADARDEARAREVMGERGVVALFLASFLGMQDLCRALLSVGVNPNGKTPFGRTPLFAAMSRDNDHVMELLLSHRAELETRDADGATAVEVARRAMAKQCLRKVRHLQLHSQGTESQASARPPGSQGQGGRRPPGLRVIRIPSGAAEAGEPSLSSATNGRPPAVALFRGDNSDRTSLLSAGNDHAHRRPGHVSAGQVNSPGPVSSQQGAPQRAVAWTPRLPPSRASFPQGGRDGEWYTWDNNLTHVSRAPSAAGTLVRTPAGSSGGGGRAAKGHGASYGSEAASLGSATPRLLPFRPTVYDLGAKGPGSVLTTYTATSPCPTTAAAATVTVQSLEREDTSSDALPFGKTGRRPCALIKYYSRLPTAPKAGPHSSSHPGQEPHGPAQEPPGRPPTRLEPGFTPSGWGDAAAAADGHRGGSGGYEGSVTGSQEALSVGSAPEPLTTSGRERESGPTTLQGPEQGESDDDGGRVLSSRGKTSSGRVRTRLLVSRQKQQESWRTMKRRIKLAEEQKRSVGTKARQGARGEKEDRETFEQWLERKRREQQRSQRSSDEDTSEDDSDAENSQAFKEWLRDLKERPLRRPHTSTPASLHRRKTRPLKDLIQVGGNTEDVAAQPDPHSYMQAYKEWRHKKTSGDTRQLGSLQDIKEAKRQLEEKRKSLLAVALTYEDWLEHTEERKKLMQTILQADLEQLAALEQDLFRTRRAPRQISFTEWRDKIDKREAEIRQRRHRMRREAELRQQQNGYAGDYELTRSSAAIAHEEWVKRKKAEAQKSRSKGKPLPDAVAAKGGAHTDMPEDEKQAAWEAWLEHKHRQEVAQLDRHLRQERQLLSSLRQKKTPTVTQC